jgi:hypothetical protein
MLVFLTTVIFFGKFLHRSNLNARSFRPYAITYSPASMIWWYIVPIASLFKPYQAFRQVWDASWSPTAPATGTTLLGFWWGSWLINNLVGQWSWRADESSVETVNKVQIVDGIISVVCATLALFVIRALAARQEAAAGAGLEDTGSD